MDTNGSHPTHPERDTIESDPAYDFAEDAPIDDAAETEEEELFEEAGRLVPLGEEDFLGDEKPVVPLGGEEFLEPEEDE
ncbi:hypothetical protein TV39_03920 [Arthrobacter sp. SPG23]|uniref:hypothetical protein n=1 Tax=Arthrobacter sp. SPG23 TaxID=1610703 RepID=UPI0005BCFD12|nr:hypothetical protein [Arthrobacter sp. SPG23]KIS28564.1 hypothetical protein TV39_03920 [Arthrobacter sp. SPG23]